MGPSVVVEPVVVEAVVVVDVVVVGSGIFPEKYVFNTELLQLTRFPEVDREQVWSWES